MRSSDQKQIRAPQGVDSRAALRDRIVRAGPYGHKENTDIYDKWFAHAPRYRFRAVDDKYDITSKTLCDVGCAFGMNLPFCASGSYGIEISEGAARFGQSVGLPIHRRDVLRDDVSDLPPVDVVWCSAVIEHVDSPHTLLRKLHLLLKPDGLLVLHAPTIPIAPWLLRLAGLGRFTRAHRAKDHVNAFVPSTLRFTCERAGFATVEVSPFLPGPLRVLDQVLLVNRLIDGSHYIGRKIEDWQYPSKAHRVVAKNERGFSSTR